MKIVGVVLRCRMFWHMARFGRAVAAAAATSLALCAGAADRTISENYALTSDETVDGTLTVNEGVAVDLAGHTLSVGGLSGDGTIFAGAIPPSIVSGESILWLDASVQDTLEVDADGKVSKWISLTGSTIAQQTDASKQPVLDTSTFGFPTVDFGAAGSGKDMTYGDITTIKTAFWVTKIENTLGAFWLGCNSSWAYHFHRGEQGQYAASYSNFSRMWNGLTEVNITADSPTADEFIVVAAQMKGNSKSNSLTNDRNINGRNGGKKLSELICFNRDLTDDERIAVTEYLQKKWFSGASPSAGVLHVSVASGATADNSGVTLAGSMKLVKDGEGEFTASKAGQTYTGGTVIDEGKITLGTSSNPLGTGNGKQLVTINTNAVLDVNNKAATSTCRYNYKLAGTVKVNGSAANWAYNAGHEVFGSYVTLFGDAHITGENMQLGSFTEATRTIYTLNGFTLNLDLTGGRYSNAKYLRMLDGTVKWNAGTTETTNVGDFSGADLVFTSDSYAHLGDNAFSARGFKYYGTRWVTHRTANQVYVSGRYVAGPIRPWMTLRSGATIDLSEMSDTWDMTGTAPSTGGANRSFASAGAVALVATDAFYTIDLGAREVAVGEKLINWSAKPAETVTFTLTCDGSTPEERKIGLSLRDDGVYVKSLLIPYARWGVDDETPQWHYYLPDGTETLDWEDGITSEVEVRFFSYAEYEAMKQQTGITPAAYVLAGTLQVPAGLDSWDMTTCFDYMAEGAVLDLNGASVTISRLSGLGTVTDTNSNDPGELHVLVPSEASIANSGVSFTGNMKLVKDGAGELVASKTDQSYTGGTVINEGTVTLGTSTNPLGAGNSSMLVTVNTNAVLDINNKSNGSTCRYNYKLAGTVKISGDANNWGYNAGHEIFGPSTELFGDAHIAGKFLLLGSLNSATPCKVDLCGHKLYLDFTDHTYMRYMFPTNGTVVITGGFIECSDVNHNAFMNADVQVNSDAYLHLGDNALAVKGFRYDGAKWATHRTANQVTVYGRYVAGAIRPWLTLQDGATIDLSEVVGSFATAGTEPVTGGAHRTFTTGGLVSFADAAVIKVELGEREKSELHELNYSDSPYLITWPSQPTATFVLEKAFSDEGYRIASEETGLRIFYVGGTILFMR